jgi:hypothetical protein
VWRMIDVLDIVRPSLDAQSSVVSLMGCRA